ncbi:MULTISPECIES: protein rhiC [Rhizobium]|uniref:Protein rhiC n=1 Tax=Rhizobium rhododendri TaxID=2506430 RepID=A0ABY8ISF8_9HYPH|nr:MULTISPECIES: protein rhiC [Rhizobium]TQX84480.1 protein rhiC [Rhizobium sp. rho-13.1]TQY08172.1 protein rhiC [Rhizobium sp. rho-1.1]WFS26261.1 protein rhiC [Rhizobium rhododendri]
MITTTRAFKFVLAVALMFTMVEPGIAGETMKVKNNATAGVTPVETGVVIRGVTLTGPKGQPGSSTGKTCDFSGEAVNQSGRMEGASVNCKPNGNFATTLPGLPQRFDAYCVIKAPVKSARLLQAPVPDNPNHCDLSGITPKDATAQFGGAVWR